MDFTEEYESASRIHQMIVEYSWLRTDDRLVCSGDGIYLAGYILESVINDQPLPEGPISGIVDSFHLVNEDEGFVKIHRKVFDTRQVSYHHLAQLEHCFLLGANTTLPINHRQVLANHYRQCLSVNLQSVIDFHEDSKDLFSCLMGLRHREATPAVLNAVSYSSKIGYHFHSHLTTVAEMIAHRTATINQVCCQDCSRSPTMLWSYRVFEDHFANYSGPLAKISSQLISKVIYDCKIYSSHGDRAIVSRQDGSWIFFFLVLSSRLILPNLDTSTG